MVSVDYGDILGITLKYNRHHFEEVMVVTTPGDRETRKVASKNKARIHLTTSFYDDGALFNKWKALEEGLELFGREGLLAIMDADVLWPNDFRQVYQRGYLYSPYRYLWPHIDRPIPQESDWERLIAFRDYEYPGYTQIFYGDDPVLAETPWYAIDWLHCGGADSDFQRRWPDDKKVRTDWKVLHLGEPYRNWGGRVSPRTDGELPALAGSRRKALAGVLEGRAVGEGYSRERLGNRPR